ncbi:flavin monoamine oxidase family protein [Hydrogenophaga sp. BPS33]|uniref:flavin monoamine oxidase family protein n=1 Tax=Hydrogenophaga sp. BPS33 TaxID=2651974 RepID=UPI00135B2AD2|nr:NAD(P)/FAD-dependent oxidoreductase [Hydrogenophaga sp. BPS33]
MKPKTDVDHDIIVVGGGFAGVTAARDCRKNGWRTLLLEARDRLGGRTYTTQLAGHKVELGGTWIHWRQPFVWAEKERYGLEVRETPGNVDPATEEVALLVRGERVLLRGQQMQPVVEALNRYFADAQALWERPFDAHHTWPRLFARDGMSAWDRLVQMDLAEPQRSAVGCYLDALANGTSREVSYNEVARWWALSGHSLPALDDACGRYALKDGTAALLEAMVKDGRPEVRLSTPVQGISDEGDHVVVTTHAGEQIRAGSVIVTLPMNVLPSVEFSPALDPMLVQAAGERHAGRGLKVVMKTRGNLGGVSKRLGLGGPELPLNIVFTYAKADDHCLHVGFGSDATKLDLNDREQVQEAARAFFPDMEVEECMGHDWVNDPYSLGTWTNYKAGWLEKYHAHFQQDRGRILFGQGDHGEGWRGFIDGAIAAGSKAALRAEGVLG